MKVKFLFTFVTVISFYSLYLVQFSASANEPAAESHKSIESKNEQGEEEYHSKKETKKSVTPTTKLPEHKKNPEPQTKEKEVKKEHADVKKDRAEKSETKKGTEAQGEHEKNKMHSDSKKETATDEPNSQEVKHNKVTDFVEKPFVEQKHTGLYWFAGVFVLLLIVIFVFT